MAVVAWLLCAMGLAAIFDCARRSAGWRAAALATLAIAAGELAVVHPTAKEALHFAVFAMALEIASPRIAKGRPRRWLATLVIVVPPLFVFSERPGWPTPARIVDVLFCSQHGALATSAVLWLGASGVVWMATHRPRAQARVLLLCLLTVLAVAGGQRGTETWRESAGAFLAAVPPMGLGLAWLAADLARAVRRHPARAAAALLAPLVIWNLTLMAAGESGALPIGDPVSFGAVGAAQARTLHEWIGHPLAFPANVIFSIANHVAPWRFDALGVSHVEARPLAIDVGSGADAFLLDGWYAEERGGGVAFRWTGDHAALLLPRVPGGRVHLRVHLSPLVAPEAPAQGVTLLIDGVEVGHMALAPGWQWIDLTAATPSLRSGVTVLTLRFDAAHRPAEFGMGGDRRLLGAAVETVELSAPDPEPAARRAKPAAPLT